MKKLSFIFICLIFALVSCQQENQAPDFFYQEKTNPEEQLLLDLRSASQNLLNEGDQTSSRTGTISPQNPNNSYDIIGVRHNDALRYALDNYDPRNSQAIYITSSSRGLVCRSKEDKMAGLVMQYHVRKLNISPGIPFSDVTALASDVANNMDLAALDIYLAPYVASGKISQTESDILELFVSTTDNLGLNNLNLVIRNAINFENTIVASGISSTAKARLLGAISVGKYSSIFWEAELSNSGSTSRGLPRWLKIIGADLIGAALGVLSAQHAGGNVGPYGEVIGGTTIGAGASALAGA